MAQALNGKIITVFGGSGFIGRHTIRILAERGYSIRAAVRRPDLAEHLQPLGAVGQIMPVAASVRNKKSVEKAVEGACAVINLVGILYEAGAQKFDTVQAKGPATIADVCKEQGIETLVHLSAIGADENSKSVYAQTKAAGEKAVLDAMPNAVIFRPSIVFGPEDDFFNRFGSMAQLFPMLPLIGGGHTKFQPVYVEDVALAIANAAERQVEGGKVYELGGPEVASFKQCLSLMLETIRRKRALVSLPFLIARIQAKFLQMFPKPMLTVDQVNLLKRDNVVSKEALSEKRTFEGLGIEPHSMEAILPTYLDKFRPHGQYEAQKPLKS
ncbi:3 beta-hydroxysteroid dehydrogenase/Delta 5--_4-isomerase [Pseudovibrio axinellae]|uniref:3 beta-hydroxysteroid dehydrogenase/Delta 5-->4-isomerase n=1 Tax=Pseudovibrio axinellae TaxID=989403 RepID=A0A165YZ32_9HYPH|nr:complex I NDUFA9 subunit family protein [Pseudovibrio axinellae]KZL19364.1 3 beta-hydroxysteroid dehydrogenase/Delta 5-->4-isomerase [Pseudovibrio axinellae]SEQ39594.1 NADH dehydrogenase [Pseudovibrio axinellae]